MLLIYRLVDIPPKFGSRRECMFEYSKGRLEAGT